MSHMASEFGRGSVAIKNDQKGLQHVGSAGGVCPAWNNVDCDYM